MATFLHFDHPKKVEASEEVEQESAQSVSHPRITLGSCEAPSGEVEVLATRPLAPAVWEAPTTRQVEIPEEARPDDGPEPQTLPYRRPSADQPTAPEMELSVRRLAGAGVYELRGTEPAYCWSLETSAVADPTCTPKEPTEDRQSVDSREEGWARVSDAGTWLGARHVYVSGPEGQQEKLEVLEVRADGGIRSAEVVLSTSTD